MEADDCFSHIPEIRRCIFFQKIILLVLKLLLKYVYLFTIGPPPLNDKGTVHFCTKRNPQKCIKKFRGEIWRRWNYFARSPHNRIPTPAPAGLRSKILWWSPTDTMAETSRTVRLPGTTGVHRTHWLSWRFFWPNAQYYKSYFL